MILCLPIIILGILGNILIIIIMLRQRSDKLPITFHLACIASTDSLTLVLFLLLESLRYMAYCVGGLSTYLSDYPMTFTLLYPLYYISRLGNSWLVILLGMDRFVVVSFIPIG